MSLAHLPRRLYRATRHRLWSHRPDGLWLDMMAAFDSAE